MVDSYVDKVIEMEPVIIDAENEGVWVETTDDTGRTYFYHTVTLESVWERPKEGYIVQEEDIEIVDDNEEFEDDQEKSVASDLSPSIATGDVDVTLSSQNGSIHQNQNGMNGELKFTNIQSISKDAPSAVSELEKLRKELSEAHETIKHLRSENTELNLKLLEYEQKNDSLQKELKTIESTKLEHKPVVSTPRSAKPPLIPEMAKSPSAVARKHRMGYFRSLSDTSLSSEGSADVRARAGGVVDVIPADEMDTVMSLMKSIPLFHSFTEQQFNGLCGSVRKAKYPAGTTILRQGAWGDLFFIIAQGRVAVRKKTEALTRVHSVHDVQSSNLSSPGRHEITSSQSSRTLSSNSHECGASDDDLSDESSIDLGDDSSSMGPIVAELSRGFFFGERALLLDEPRAASCVALNSVVCYVLGRHAFKAVLSDVGELLGSYSERHYVESPEFLSLSSYIGVTGALTQAAIKAGVKVDSNNHSDTLSVPPSNKNRDVSPQQALLDAMSAFTPENGLAATLERVCQVTATLIQARCVRILLFNKDENSFCVPAPSAVEFFTDPDAPESQELLRNAFGHSHVSLTQTGGVVAKIPLGKAGYLSQVCNERSVLHIENMTNDERFVGNNDNSKAWRSAQQIVDDIFCSFVKIAADRDCMCSSSKNHCRDAILNLMDYRAAFDDASSPIPSSKKSEMLVVPALHQGSTVAVIQIIGKRDGGQKPLKSRHKSFSAVVGQPLSSVKPEKASVSYHGTFSAHDTEIAYGVADCLAQSLECFQPELDAYYGTRSFVPQYTMKDLLTVHVGRARKLRLPKTWLQRLKNGKSIRSPTSITAEAVMRVFHGATELCQACATAAVPVILTGEDDTPLSPLAISRTTSVSGPESPAMRRSSSATSNELEPNGGSSVSPDVFVTAEWAETLTAPIRIADLPPAARVVFEIHFRDGSMAGWTGVNLMTYQQVLQMGQHTLYMWPGVPTSAQIATTTSPSNEHNGVASITGRIEIELFKFSQPVLRTTGAIVAAQHEANIHQRNGVVSQQTERPFSIHDVADVQEYERVKPQLMQLFRCDPLYSMTHDERRKIWRSRHFLLGISSALPKLLLSTQWNDCMAVEQVYSLLPRWTILEPVEALQLLDMKFPDPRVRAYAVNCLEQLDNDDLHQYMLQLTQVLKFEPYLDSALARFLLRRALRQPRIIGHVLYWYLKAEMHIAEVAARYGVILEQYLRNCGEHRTELGHQMFVMTKLEHIAMEVKAASTKAARLQTVQQQVKSIVFPERFQLPISPHMVVCAIEAEQCRVMSSKKLPLWLCFKRAPPAIGSSKKLLSSMHNVTFQTVDENEEHDDSSTTVSTKDVSPLVRVLFKAGDDLRQDQLTLQILGIMDKLWHAEGLDLCMNAYNCISTGDELGMLEVVENADTLAGIVKDEMAPSKKTKKGFRQKLKAAMDAMWKESVLRDWLMKQEGNAENFSSVEDRFARSCAGYCVATYVLGIGDRHNDNIMLTRDGRLFHIDFGHFLGNFKSKLGYKREKAPFVFTPAFAAVLGGTNSDKYKEFETLCCDAYNVLRRHANLLLTLFFLMLSCGIPELREEKDMIWLRDKLMIGASDSEAATSFKQLIKQSMNTRATLLNHAVHSFAHG